MLMKSYGLRVFEAGFILRRDGWRLIEIDDGSLRLVRFGSPTRGDRGAIRAFSHGSRRRLEFIAANASAAFRTIVTLTYHAKHGTWEGDGARNLRIVKRSKRDLNRFLTCVRRDLGRYLWVQEFQQRGAIHYHLMCEGEPSESRIACAWCRATGELDDAAALKYAAKVEAVRGEKGVRSYLGRYLGKGRQKSLPVGVDRAGRWWGRSKGLRFDVIGISREREETVRRALEVRVLRSVRCWLRGEMGFLVSGGMFVDWGGRLSRRLLAVAAKLQEFYAPTWADEAEGRWSFVETTATGGGE
jgi:hypothetical protein